MSAKLTLSMEQSIVEQAKRYARRRERSLSQLTENYLKAITNEESAPDPEYSPKVNSLRGSFKMLKNFDYKKELHDRLAKKYLGVHKILIDTDVFLIFSLIGSLFLKRHRSSHLV